MKALKSNIAIIISIIVILACMAPMLYFFKAAVLGGDDFLYGRDTFHALQDTGSYLNAVKIAFKGTWDTYLGWQGSFFSVFLMYLHPGIISLSLYRIALAMIFILSIISPCVAVFVLNRHYLKAPKKYIWPILASYIFVITQYMPSIYQAYYWYSSAIYYQFTLSIVFLFIAASASCRNAKSKILRGFLIAVQLIMCVMIGGSNFPIGLVFAVSFALYIAMAYIKKFERRKVDTIVFAVFLAFFLANVLAPGNGGRQAATPASTDLFSAAIASVRDMAIETPTWIKSTLTLGIICAMLPLGRKITENSKLKFVHPALAGLVIALILLAQYYPVEFGMGSKGPQRVENIRFMLLNLGLWLFTINMFGYLRGREKEANIYVATVLAIALIAISLSDMGINKLTSYKMADQITSGELDNFSQITGAELTQFENKQSREPVYYGDHITNEFLHPDITFWFHSGIWDYYRKSPEK